MMGAQEVALVGMLGYMSYLTGELLGLSGIVTLFCCAVAISHYALHNVSSMSRVTIVSAFQTLSYVSEGAIFIYVGMDMLDPIKWKVCRAPSTNAPESATPMQIHEGPWHVIAVAHRCMRCIGLRIGQCSCLFRMLHKSSTRRNPLQSC